MSLLDGSEVRVKDMRLKGPVSYRITLCNRKCAVSRLNGESTFTAPATTRGLPKLYVVSQEDRIIYVGVTSQPMATRLRQGTTATGDQGYYGYAWCKSDGVANLSIWWLDAHDVKKAMRELETVEAEVTFLWRKTHSQWPEGQTEIHFHPSRHCHRRCAGEILRHFGQRRRQRTV